MTQRKQVYQLAQDDIVWSKFTQADGAIATLPTAQTVVSSGSPVTVSNQASLPTTAKVGVTHASSDVLVKAKCVSKLGEAVYVRADATGYYYAANEAAGTTFNYFLIAGSVKTVLLGPITGNAANDVLSVEALGTTGTVIRNNKILGQVPIPNSPTAKEHGIRNPAGVTVLMDELLIIPIY